MRATLLTVTYLNGDQRAFSIGSSVGWRVDRFTGSLVIGRGVPRVHVPLVVIREWELS